jgi:hypothetical protein
LKPGTGKANSPYVVDNDVVVNANAVLTIQAGTIVKFNDWVDDIWVDGSLRANGTASEPVVFTSLLDDTHGGDTNGDDGATQGGVNQWGGILFQAGSVLSNFCISKLGWDRNHRCGFEFLGFRNRANA